MAGRRHRDTTERGMEGTSVNEPALLALSLAAAGEKRISPLVSDAGSPLQLANFSLIRMKT